MSNVFVNIVLKNDLKELKQKVNDIEISKGDVSGNSIEITELETNSQSSYVYYDRAGDRDRDYELLMELIETKIEEDEQ
jgi:hypothetical protein